MSTLIKAFVILVLIAAILGGSAYFAYELFWKPKELDRQEQEEIAAAAALPPPPHPGIAAFEAAAQLASASKVEAAKTALKTLLAQYPDSPKLAETKALLGNLNAAAVFSSEPGPTKTPYVVVKGDALAKIASRTGVGSELLFRVNNLETLNLQIGQVLQAPTLSLSAVVNRQDKTLTLFNGEEFFKEYPLAGATVPGLAQGKVLEAKVSDKFVMKEGKRVAFGDKNYAGGERTVLLSPGGASLRVLPADAATPPPGLVLSPEDLDEVFILVNRGTPITIQ